MGEEVEEIRSQGLIEEIQTPHHISSSLVFLEYGDHKAQTDELESLDEGAIGTIVIYGIHLEDAGIGVGLHISEVVLVFSAFEISSVFSFFVRSCLFFGDLTGGFSPQVDVVDADDGKDIPVDIVIEGFFRDADLRVVLYDLVRGMPLVQQGLDERSKGFGLRGGEVDPLPGVHQGLAVLIVGQCRIIIKLVKSAVSIIAAAVAGTGGTIPAGAGERDVVRTGRPAVPAVGAPGIGGAFQGERTLMPEYAVEPDLFAYGRLILPDGVCDSGFGRLVADTGLNDPAFVESERFILVLSSQNRPPFRQKCLWKSYNAGCPEGEGAGLCCEVRR